MSTPLQPTFHTPLDHSDGRGDSLALPARFLAEFGCLRELHLVTLAPRAVRGNHVHDHDEMLLVLHRGNWVLHWWQEGQDTESRHFSGVGQQLITLPAGLWHALKNLADTELIVTSASASTFDPQATRWDRRIQ